MFAKRSQLIKNIESVLSNDSPTPAKAVEILKMVELFMEPNLRPLTEKEVENHVLVQQVSRAKKEEVKDYVRNLEYEHKREFVPEDT